MPPLSLWRTRNNVPFFNLSRVEWCNESEMRNVFCPGLYYIPRIPLLRVTLLNISNVLQILISNRLSRIVLYRSI